VTLSEVLSNLVSHIQDFLMRYFTNLEALYFFELSVPHTYVLSEVLGRLVRFFTNLASYIQDCLTRFFTSLGALYYFELRTYVLRGGSVNSNHQLLIFVYNSGTMLKFLWGSSRHGCVAARVVIST
jgi:hypothetical protein